MTVNTVHTDRILNGEARGMRISPLAPEAGPRPGLRELLAGGTTFALPGATDALTARLAERAGFGACYVSGAGFANVQLGLPDVGMVSNYEMANHIRRIADAVSIPVIADGDTGHGGVLAVTRTVRLFEQAGASAIQLEDQEMPKRCGHFDGRRQLVDAEEMAAKIRAAKAAASSPDFVVIARTDARAVLGIDEAIRRGKIFRDSGADVVFIEAMQTRQELEAVPLAVPDVPLMVNIVEGGKTPELAVSDYRAMGYRIVLYANFVMRVMAKAAEDALSHLNTHGETLSMHPRMLAWQKRQELVALEAWQELERRLEEG